MSENRIAAVSRTEFGKGAARRTRRDGLVPAVLYGHGSDPVHLSLPAHDLGLALRVANALLTLSVDGDSDVLALPKQVQRNPIRGSIEHLDLVIVRLGEKVTVDVPLVLLGEEKIDGLVVMDQQSISLEAEATNIPASIEISLDGLVIGDTITAGDLVLPEGAVFHGSPTDLILSIAEQRAAEAEAGEETEAEAAEGEATEE